MNNTKLISSIIGYPLNKPRSVFIWNNYFKQKKINAKIRSIEIKKNKLESFFINFRENKNFVSTLVTMPLKKISVDYVDKLHNSVQITKTTNLIIKKNNNLIAYNTDVLAAHKCLKKYLRSYNNIVIIGLGGTGEAIFRYLYNKTNNKNFILISKTFKAHLKRVKIKKKIDVKIIQKKSIIINCTPLGSNLKKSLINKTPISKKLFSFINKTNLIYDIIYKPKFTNLSKLCKANKINYINGVEMNSIQANLGIKLVYK